VSDIVFAGFEQFQSSQDIIGRDATAAVDEHHVITGRLDYSAADGVSFAVVLSVSDYIDSYPAVIFIARFLCFVSCCVTAAVVGNYNFPVEAVFHEKFAGRFDVASDFAAFVKCRDDD
jgi:hypothetical protein